MDMLPDFLFDPILGKPAWMWALFLGVVLAVLVRDLGVLHEGQNQIGVAENLKLPGFYFAVAFAARMWWA